MTSQESPIASATTRHGLLAYGVRRIRSDTMSLFKKDFEAWIISHSAHLNAAFAFPEPSDVDLLHLLFWTKTSDAGVLEELSSNAFAELDDDSDGVFPTVPIRRKMRQCIVRICYGRHTILPPWRDSCASVISRIRRTPHP